MRYDPSTRSQNSAKGQIKPKADWRAVDSPKKQTNEFVLFAFLQISKMQKFE